MLKNSIQDFKQKFKSTPKKPDPQYWPKYKGPHQFFETKFKSNKQISNNCASSKKIQNKSLAKSRPIMNATKQSINGEMTSSQLKYHKKMNYLSQTNLEFKKTLTSTINDKTSIIESERESTINNNDNFIENLESNSLFYCCQCFQYVFEIEKKRHYPYCKDRIVVDRKEPQSHKMAWDKLKKLVELARYSNTSASQVEELFNEVTKNNFNRIYGIQYNQKRKYFTLKEIKKAFVYTYQNLLKGIPFQQSSLFMCF